MVCNTPCLNTNILALLVALVDNLTKTNINESTLENSKGIKRSPCCAVNDPPKSDDTSSKNCCPGRLSIAPCGIHTTLVAFSKPA